MGLAAFNRMRIRQVEKMKPENIVKEQKKAVIQEQEEQPTIIKRKPKNNE